MNTFFSFGGRGTRKIKRSSIFNLDPNPGAVLLITKRVGGIDFVCGYCRSAIVDKWGCYCAHPFIRVSSPDLRKSWWMPMESDLMIYHAVTLHLVPEEDWMRDVT
jgi:hypothetical protein